VWSGVPTDAVLLLLPLPALCRELLLLLVVLLLLLAATVGDCLQLQVQLLHIHWGAHHL
jgi:hypothetical protein